MKPARNSRRTPDQGFTLIELVLVLTIISLMIGASIPSFTGLQNERAAREPVSELLLLAKDARYHARLEKRPYQIILDQDGAFAMRYAGSYEERGEFKERFAQALTKAEEKREMIQKNKTGDALPLPGGIGTTQSESIIDSEPWESEPSWLASYEFPDDVICSVKSWGEGDFTNLNGEEMRRWVFQPSGLCDPLTVRMERDGAYFQVTFDALTADIAKEESYVE